MNKVGSKQSKQARLHTSHHGTTKLPKHESVQCPYCLQGKGESEEGKRAE